MKFALGLLVCCILAIAGTIVFAPEYAHEIIDKFHGNPENITKPQVRKDNNENSNNKANEGNNIVDKSESPIQEGNAFYAPQRSNTENQKTSEPPVQKGYEVHTKPSTKEQLLEWLKSEDYRVAAGQGFYRITWIYRKPSLTKPSAVIISREGKVSIRYEKNVVIKVDGASILGQNVDVNGNGNSIVGIGTIDIITI